MITWKCRRCHAVVKTVGPSWSCECKESPSPWEMVIDNSQRQAIIIDIESERSRQSAKFGEQRAYNLNRWLTILGEEYGEACEALNDADLHRDQHRYTKFEHKAALRTELIQVAAVAVAIIEQLDERGMDA